MKIRTVTLDDINLLQKISIQTFFETFSEMNSKENMTKYLQEAFAKERLIEELNNKNSIFYFAVVENEVAGYLKLNFASAQTELQNSKGLEIERIYVLKKFQGQKIGKKFYDLSIQLAIKSAVDYVWLGVWENNIKARHFYEKNGFIEFDKHIFRLGDDEQTDIMMKYELKGLI